MRNIYAERCASKLFHPTFSKYKNVKTYNNELSLIVWTCLFKNYDSYLSD